FQDGRSMLDWTCGIGVTNLAASEQCLNLNHAQVGRLLPFGGCKES
ncbi:hypothetical protein MPER_14580, partial [Moniliophthora perniciosa FA553]